MNIIETHNLTKRYRDFTAVNKLNMHVKKGQVYGFLGPNGAGKSTTMKMFLGLTRPTSGDFQIKGLSYPKDRMEILRQTGAFIESPTFYGNLTGEENLEIIRRILKLPKASVRDALELTGLYEFRKRLASKYSLGMKQRLIEYSYLLIPLAASALATTVMVLLVEVVDIVKVGSSLSNLNTSLTLISDVLPRVS